MFPGLARAFFQDTKSDTVIHEKLRLGLVEKTKSPRTKRPSLIRNEISRIKRENLGEELRVLYVALTRAKEKIILTETFKCKNPLRSIKQCKCEPANKLWTKERGRGVLPGLDYTCHAVVPG